MKENKSKPIAISYSDKAKITHYKMGSSLMWVGAVHITAQGIKRLQLFDGITYLYCPFNELRHLEIPEGLATLSCFGNKFKSLKLPKSLTLLGCDKELFDYDTCEVDYVHIHYQPNDLDIR